MTATPARRAARAAALLATLISAAAGGRSLALAAEAPQGIEIDRIEINGATVFPAEQIEGALELQPGDRLERLKVFRTSENLQNLYRSHGYDALGIRSRLLRRAGENGALETVLEFDLSEGQPTRVAAVDFEPSETGDARAQKRWKTLEPVIASSLGVKAGDIADPTKLAAGRRAILEALASKEFVGARVEDAEPVAVDVGKPGRWVKLGYRIDLGDRVDFGFRGNTIFSNNQLEAIVDEQRLLGLGKDYVTAIRAHIEDEYRGEGFASVRISVLTSEAPAEGGRHVTYVIEEGARASIESVDFDGNNVFSSSELRKQFYAKAPYVVQKGYYSEKDVQKAAALLIEWMKSKGYLAAKLVTINTLFPKKPRTEPQNSSVQLILYVYEGDQTVVQNVALNGLKALSVDEAETLLGVREGEPLNLFSLTDGIQKLKQAYRSRGYLGVAISNEGTDTVVSYSNENRTADVRIDIVEGPMYRVSRIEIEGLVKTHEVVVSRELVFRVGEPLGEGLIRESEANLRKLGIFSGVNVRPFDDPAKPGYKVVRVTIQEGTPGVWSVGVGYRNDLGVRAFGQVAYTDLFGMNQTGSASLSANVRTDPSVYHFPEAQAQLSYLWPWFLLNNLSFRPTISVGATQYIFFDAANLSLTAALERQLFKRPNLTFGLAYALERIQQFNAQSALDDGNLLIGNITASLRLDLRDNALTPTKGFFGSLSFEVADPRLGSQNNSDLSLPPDELINGPIGYYKILFRGDTFVPITKDIIWYFSFRTGFGRNTYVNGEIPLIKQFALGGVDSLRGWNELELNFSNQAIQGVMAFVNYRTQIDLPLAGALRISPFIDAANLRSDADFPTNAYSLFEGLNFGYGVGLRYITPVGPVSLDIGFKFRPPPTGDFYHIYFSVGVI